MPNEPDDVSGRPGTERPAGGASASRYRLGREATKPLRPLSLGDRSSGHVLLADGQLVDHFKVLRLLGRGGMGEVYLARDTKLGRKVALKLVQRSALGEEEDAVDRFLFEARMTAKFSHPNIVMVYAVGEHEGLPYIALEYLRGQSLADRMEGEFFTPRETARIGLAIAEALVEAHRHQVLHRDLKPENVLVPPDGRLRVLDFGLARQVDEAPARSERGPRRSGQSTVPPRARLDSIPESDPFVSNDSAKGTPHYMSPEQWAGCTLDGAADVWALGLIMYELASGQHPFEDLNLSALVATLAAPTAVAPMVNYDELPRPLVDLIRRCLAKDSSERPTAAEVRENLKAFLQFGGERLDEGESPFRGLLPFTEQHADYFFGRDAEINRFLEQLRRQALLAVVGPSGAGKSSFVRAGVIARLQDGERWLVIRMRPGSQPFETLAQQLLRAPDAEFGRISTDFVADEQSVDEGDVLELVPALTREPGRLALELRTLAARHAVKVLLFVDQLEELVTLLDDEVTRTDFMRALCQAADEPLDPVRVVMTVRDDFISRLALSGEVHEALRGMFFLQRPGVEALEATLRNPIGAAGYAYDDPELPSVMVEAVRDEPACLPLLQFAAQKLWEERDRSKHLLLRTSYEAMGGVEGALVQQANGVLDELSAAETRSARQLLLRLVTTERTRKVVTRGELLEGLGAEASAVLERLAVARLLTLRKKRGAEEPQSTVELAHEALIARWDTLRRWLDESQEELIFLAEAGQAAELWHKRGRRDAELWQGEALIDASRMMLKSGQAVPERVRRFVEVAKRKEARRLRLRRLLFSATLVALTLVAVVLAWQKNQADKQRARAEQKEAEALVEGARAAWGHGHVLEARAKLRLALQSADTPNGRALWWQLQDDARVWRREVGALVYAVDFSADGKQVAAACQDTSVYLLDVKTQAVRVLRGHEDQVFAVRFSPDGSQLASGDWRGRVRLWDVRTGKVKRVLSDHTAGIRGLAFSSDGKWIASGGVDKTVRVWNAHSGKVRHVLTGHTAAVWGLSFNPEGDLLASGSVDKTVRIWDVQTGSVKRVSSDHAATVRDVAFSPRGGLLASSSDDKSVRLWEARTGKLKAILSGHTAEVQSVSFSPNGELLVSGSDDQSVRVWDVATGKEKRALHGHSATVRGVSFSPKGDLIVTGSNDRTVRLWDAHAAQETRTLSGHTAAVLGMSFSPKGDVLVSGGNDRTVRVWDVRTGRVERVLSGHGAGIYGISFSPDGHTIASGSGDKTARLWDLHTGQAKRILSGHTAAIRGIGFSRDGNSLATASGDKTVRVWDVHTGEVKHTFTGHTTTVWDARFSLDGRSLASASGDKTVRLWDLTTGREKRVLSGYSGAVHGVSFSSDGRLLASGSGGKTGTLHIWDMHAGRETLSLGQPARAYWLDFHPDGRRVGVPSSDGVARIWNIDQGKVERALRGHSTEVNFLRFSPDGKWAATSSDDNTVRLWEVDSGRPVWWAPILLASPPRLLSHRGWNVLEQGGSSVGSEQPALEEQVSQSKWKLALAQRARTASLIPNGKLLCLGSFDSALELWAVEGDRRLRVEHIEGLTELRAVPEGCLVRSVDEEGGRALLLGPEGKIKVLGTHGKVTGIGANERELFVAAGKQIFVFDTRGKATARVAADIGVRSIVRIDRDRLVVGYANGNLDLLRVNGPASTSNESSLADHSFERTPSSPVTRMVLGPMDTLVAGYANGVVGMWSWRDGKRLADGRIHGPIEHLLLEKEKLYAASELGPHLVWDLRELYADRCTLIRELWKRVPVVWRDGQAVIEVPPDEHPCSFSASIN